jgi:hypothetical protein
MTVLWIRNFTLRIRIRLFVEFRMGMVKIMKLPLLLMVFVDVYIHFRIWIRIRNPRVTDPDQKKVPDPWGSGSISTTVQHGCGPGPLLHQNDPASFRLRNTCDQNELLRNGTRKTRVYRHWY